MSAGADKLARMANDIAKFFRAYPEAEAIAGIQDHIVAFWSPRMRDDLAASIESLGGRVDPLVVSAFLRISSATSPTHKATAGPETVGPMGSDAG